MKYFGSPELGDVYLFRALGERRTFCSGLIAICGLPLLFLAAGPAFPGRTLPGCSAEAQHFKKTASMPSVLGLTSRLYSDSPSGLWTRFDGELCQHQGEKVSR